MFLLKSIRFIPLNLVMGFIVILLNTGCERSGPFKPNQAQLEATLSSIQTHIFNQNCALSGCHLGSSAPHGLDLSAGQSYGNLVNVFSKEVPSLMRVKPGDPDNSYLVRKVEGGPGILGERMPRGRSPLSQEEIQTIREWISAGAMNN